MVTIIAICKELLQQIKYNILWLGSNTFRVYDFSEKNFNKLLNGLSLHNYIDTEISAAVFVDVFLE